MISMEVRVELEKFVEEAYKCETAEQARDILRRVEQFSKQHEIPAKEDIFLQEGVGEMLYMMATA